MTDATRHPSVQVRDAVRDLAETEYRDGGGGGIATATLAEHMDKSQSAIGTWCQDLVARGALVKVTGLAYDTGKPRPSYLPAEHPDAPDDAGEDVPDLRAYRRVDT